MRRLRWFPLGALVLTLSAFSGCGDGDGGQDVSQPAADVSGTWHYVSSSGDTGTATYSQAGNTVAGTLHMDRGGVGQMTGTIEGYTVSLSIDWGGVVTTAVATISEDQRTLSGSWTETDGDRGTFVATRR
jgi:hypothetical protein